ncbi:terpene synthase family protein [Streptomyces sp. NBC_00378]|uniref:terpene synthase family protein n=1 Tax=unclassified Streptomyces TaxID=2593676 RepID=UPI002258B05A|nr:MULTISPECIES: terpene synthase family protein [unclassified Streptomyces]MCX5114851.1 terpene synthase family protein [Streptomyces sp. NBC_00378]
MSHTRSPDARTLPMPDLRGSFPGPFATSPYADAIEEQTAHWLGTFPLVGSPGEAKALCNITAQGVARLLPTADRDGVFLCADLFLWLTAFDDVHGEAEGGRDTARLVRRISHCVHVLAGHDEPAVDDDAGIAALRELLHRFRERATPTQYLRLTAHLRDNLFGILWEAHHLDRPDKVTLSDYYAMRPHTVFVRTVMTTAEVVLGYELTEDQRASAAVRELEKAVAHLAGWINDLASYVKETDHGGQTPLSLPTLLIRHRECDLEGAFRLASRMCEDQASTARLRLTELAATGENALADHAHAMEAVAASYVWHIGHARYQR